jgi:hypothetical protein
MRFRAAALLAFLLALAGCERPTANRTLEYAVGSREGHPTLTVGGVTLVFEGQTVPGPDNPARATGFFQVAGLASSAGKAPVPDVDVLFAYAKGTNTVTVGGQNVTIRDEGAELVVGDRTFILGGDPRLVWIGKDGAVRPD